MPKSFNYFRNSQPVVHYVPLLQPRRGKVRLSVYWKVSLPVGAAASASSLRATGDQFALERCSGEFISHHLQRCVDGYGGEER